MRRAALVLLKRAYSDPALEQFLTRADVKIFKPGQYMDKWRLNKSGVQPVANTTIKRALGFSDVQTFPK
jgi:hypothetical protein